MDATAQCFAACQLSVAADQVPVVNCPRGVDRARLTHMLAGINVRAVFTVERPKYVVADYYPVVELHWR